MGNGANGKISLQSMSLPVNGAEVDELERLCNENDIEFQRILFRIDSVQASALWSWVTIVFSPKAIKALAKKIDEDGTCDLIKQAVKKVVDIVRSKMPHPTKVKKSSLIELKSASAHLKIEADHFSAETYSEAFNTFIKVSEETFCEDQKVVPTFVVISGDNDIEIMEQNDYTLKYVAHKKTDKGDESHGQP